MQMTNAKIFRIFPFNLFGGGAQELGGGSFQHYVPLAVTL